MTRSDKAIAAGICIGLTAIGGCSMSSDAKSGEAAVATFHQMLNAGQFDAIYAGSTDDLKRVSSHDQFVALLVAVHQKLGTTTASSETGWRVNYGTHGTDVILSYATTFTGGSASESFDYRIDGAVARMVGYRINSNALIVK